MLCSFAAWTSDRPRVSPDHQITCLHQVICLGPTQVQHQCLVPVKVHAVRRCGNAGARPSFHSLHSLCLCLCSCQRVSLDFIAKHAGCKSDFEPQKHRCHNICATVVIYSSHSWHVAGITLKSAWFRSFLIVTVARVLTTYKVCGLVVSRTSLASGSRSLIVA